MSNRIVYASTACVKPSESLSDRIEHYRDAGIDHIELGAGVSLPSDDVTSMLSSGGLYLIHNYFPPPKEEFVLNLASADKHVRKLSIDLARNALTLSAELGAPFYSVHSGFVTDPTGFGESSFLFPEPESPDAAQEALKRFVDSLHVLLKDAEKTGVNLIIENNVCTADMRGKLLLQTTDEFEELFAQIQEANVGILVDTGHLNVSSHTFGFDRLEFINRLGNHIRAFHVHDNDGSADQHKPVMMDSWVLKAVTNPAVQQCPLIVEAKFSDVLQLAAHANWLSTAVK